MECYICGNHHMEVAKGSTESLSHQDNAMYFLPCGRTGHMCCLYQRARQDDFATFILRCQCKENHFMNDWRKVRVDVDELTEVRQSVTALQEELSELQEHERFCGYGDYATTLLDPSPVWVPRSNTYCLNCFGADHVLGDCPNDFFIREKVKTGNQNGFARFTTRIERGSKWGAGMAYGIMMDKFVEVTGVGVPGLTRELEKKAFTGMVGMAFWNKMCHGCGCPFHTLGASVTRPCLDNIALDAVETAIWDRLREFLETHYGVGSTLKPKEEMGFLPAADMSAVENVE